MIERFLRIKDPILRSLNDLNLNLQWLEEDEINAFNILECLKACRIAIEALNRPNANLLTAEGVLKFLFKTLAKNISNISNHLLNSLMKQIEKRQDASLVSLLKFLQDPANLKKVEENVFFKSTSKYDITYMAKSILNRLYNNGNLNTTIPYTSTHRPTAEIDSPEYELSRQLEELIRQSLAPIKTVESDFRSLSKEIDIYEASGKITSNLEMLKNALFCIKPTSMQNERNFISGIFVSKHYICLADKSIDCLCVLKSYFDKNYKYGQILLYFSILLKCYHVIYFFNTKY